MTPKKAIFWTLFWILAACIFNAGACHFLGGNKASEFANVYIVEKLLSFDNLFVFLLIFNYFKVPDKDRRKVLNYGLLGAAIFRAIAIGLGITIVQSFHWLLYCLGGLLIYSAWSVAFCEDDEENISESRIIKFAKSFSISPFLIWIVAIELSDIAFAIDSIPASLSISQDVFVVYAANIFAILGLRSFYFAIQAIYGILPQLKYGIGLILAFIGAKMFLPLADVQISSMHSLMAVISILIINSLVIFAKVKSSRKVLMSSK